jgi:UDP-glucose 4-epimerase
MWLRIATCWNLIMPCERVLLIGGGGFIGQALSRRLASEGREVHVLGRHVEHGLHDAIMFHRGCQSDATVVAPLLKYCDAVVHLASATTPGSSAHAPALDVAENLVPLAGFLEALAEAGPKRVLFLSSGGAIYGNPLDLPAKESHPAQPLSWHAAGKAVAEIFLETYARQTGASVAILRPSNVYGPGQNLQAGFGFVRTLLEKARSGEAADIWGSGKQVRDFLYIDDLVDACVRLLDAPAVAGIFNAGSGVGVSLLELVALVRQVTGQDLLVNSQPGRGIDVEGIWLDCRKLSATVGWQAHTSLAEGVRRTWEWLVNQSSVKPD